MVKEIQHKVSIKTEKPYKGWKPRKDEVIPIGRHVDKRYDPYIT